ncbi:ribose 5-phosphate isomerase B [Carboxylicivirga mesophila]|uniref:Ribose 5-phosphate isomerase B n=1 Tax=Carboxylicivirga mesophila TaxID=1166478 RepID=A0ABS5KC51_9BACT|nr:ribose 5-phosphate isomerase B [Carboxylicivirga mesophila]MBS2212516.1 ribose 5-phosphate isomerase B [Carboxylicivirga mesophila]
MIFKSIALAADHAGFPVKEAIKAYLEKNNITVKDYGTYSEDSTDYADYAHPMATAVENKEYEIGIAVCGSGNGINMTANKHQGIRAALCWNVEISEMARLHNDANVCTVPGRYVSIEEAINIVDKFVNTEFEGGRHQKRIEKIPVK